VAAFTANTTGAWNSSTTWSGAGIPGSGDTGTINTGVTVTIPDGYTATIGTTGGTTGTTALTINTTAGKLIIGQGASGQLNLQGDLSVGGTGGSGLTMSAGSQLRFVPANAQRIQVVHSTNNAGCNSVINGSASARCSVLTDPTALAGGGLTGYFHSSAGAQRTLITATYCDFTDLGDGGTNGSMVFFGSTAGQAVTVDHCTWTRCERISVNANGNNTGNINFTNNSMSASVTISSNAYLFNFNNALTSGQRNFTGNSFDKVGQFTSVAGCTIQNNVFNEQCVFSDTATSQWAVNSNNIYSHSSSASIFISAQGDLSSNYIIHGFATNPHYIGYPTTLNYGPNIDSCIFENINTSNDGQGDCVDIGNTMASSGLSTSVTRCLVLPTNGTTKAAGVLITRSDTGNPSNQKVEHNTICIGGQPGASWSESVKQPSGCITSWKANLHYGLSSGQYKLWTSSWQTSGAFVDICSPTNCDYNASFNCHTEEPSVFAGSATRYTITGCANNGSGLIRVTFTGSPNFTTSTKIYIEGVVGTTEANNTGANQWTVTNISANVVDLQGSTFTNTYVSGGIGCTTYPFAGNGYQAHFSAYPAAHDLADQDPQLVDATRNIGTWYTVGLGNTTTGTYAGDVAAAMTYCAGSPAARIAALMAWVWAGFRPQNAALEAASYPGDTSTTDAAGNSWPGGAPGIGAMAYVNPPIPMDLVFPNIPAAFIGM